MKKKKNSEEIAVIIVEIISYRFSLIDLVFLLLFNKLIYFTLFLCFFQILLSLNDFFLMISPIFYEIINQPFIFLYYIWEILNFIILNLT